MAELTTTRHQSLKGLSAKRINRIVDEILPLMSQGLTTREIASKINMSKTQVALDVDKAKEMLAERYVDVNIDQVRGEAIARQDWIYGTAIEAWNMSRLEGTPVAKFLDVASAAAKEKVKLCGAEIDLKLIQQNVNVTMASAEQVASTFEPMSSADFAAFAAAHVDAQARAAAASKAIMPEPTPILESADQDDQPDWLDNEADDGDHSAQGKNRRVSHPTRG